MIVRSARNIPGRPEFWDIPKGQLERGEKGIDAAIREGGEETGVKNFSLVPEFKETVRYFTRRGGKPVPKFVAVFLARAHEAKVELSWEHDKYQWATFSQATQKLTTMKPALEKAEKFLAQPAPKHL